MKQLMLPELWTGSVRENGVGLAGANVLRERNSIRQRKRKNKHERRSRGEPLRMGDHRGRQMLITDVWSVQPRASTADYSLGVVADWPSTVNKISTSLNAEGVTFDADYPSGRCDCAEVCRFGSCQNARQGIFCTPACCNLDAACENSKNSKVKMALIYSRVVPGLGVEACEACPAGVIMGEYVGRLRALTSESGLENQSFALEMKTKALHLHGKNIFIDAANEGNYTRFMNHSCEASAGFEELRNGKEVAVVVVSRRNIVAGEEITVDYGERVKFPCVCGSRQCRRPQT